MKLLTVTEAKQFLIDRGYQFLGYYSPIRVYVSPQVCDLQLQKYYNFIDEKGRQQSYSRKQLKNVMFHAKWCAT